MSDDRGFEVVDKRRTRTEGEGRRDAAEGAAEPEAEQAAAEQAAGEAENAYGYGPDAQDEEADEEADEEFNGMPDVTVTGVLWTSVHLLVPRVWSAMGLIPNPATGKIERDLAEARRAIDVLGDLAKHLQPGLEDQERRELQNTLTDLRVNFMRQGNQ